MRTNQKSSRKKAAVISVIDRPMPKYNALKHGALSDVVTSYDKPGFEDLKSALRDELNPCSLIEEILVERVAYYLLRLQRVAKAETEHLRRCLDPSIKRPLFEDPIMDEIVEKEGYEPKIKHEDMEPIYSLFFRYEKSLENRLYRAFKELARIRRDLQFSGHSPYKLQGVNQDIPE